MKKIPYYPAIREGVCQFIVENYCYALLNYVDDFNTDRARDFYTKAHEAFLSDLFGEMDFSQCWNERLYSNYQIVRNNDYDSLMQKLNRRVIVSMTSFPKRINSVACALQTIYGQTKKPDDIILWLAEDEFPMREKQLPHDLIELIGNGKLSVRWCDDLKPHKKYFYALQEFSEDLIVTIDDDLRYPPDLIEALFRSYLCHSDSVSAVRTHLMIVDDKRELLPYESWPKVFSVCVGKPSMQLLCTGGAGALYPAYLFKGYNFDKEPVLEHCMYADDLWLKLIELSLGIPVVTAKRNYKLQFIEGTQEDALYSNNKTMNDIQLRNSIAWFESQFGEGFIVSQILDNHSFENLMRADVLCQYYNLENRKAKMDTNRLRHDLDSVHASASFRIGRAITWLPRKIRGGVRCYKEHGIRYTFNRTLFHLHLRKK